MYPMRTTAWKRNETELPPFTEGCYRVTQPRINLSTHTVSGDITLSDNNTLQSGGDINIYGTTVTHETKQEAPATSQNEDQAPSTLNPDALQQVYQFTNECLIMKLQEQMYTDAARLRWVMISRVVQRAFAVAWLLGLAGLSIWITMRKLASEAEASEWAQHWGNMIALDKTKTRHL